MAVFIYLSSSSNNLVTPQHPPHFAAEQPPLPSQILSCRKPPWSYFETFKTSNIIDLPRTRLNADEQMCRDFCRIPIIDYHRHCVKCSNDICLRCCQDVRKASKDDRIQDEDKNIIENQEKPLKLMRLSSKLCDRKANTDGSVPCPPKQHGGCGNLPLMLKHIFKMNWVAKLVKNVDEMVSGCKIYDINPMNNLSNFLYAPSCEDIKSEGIGEFRRHWIKGEPVIVKAVCDEPSMLGWDLMVMWKGIQETTDERTKEDNRIVKAIDCFDRFEVRFKLFNLYYV